LITASVCIIQSLLKLFETALRHGHGSGLGCGLYDRFCVAESFELFFEFFDFLDCCVQCFEPTSEFFPVEAPDLLVVERDFLEVADVENRVHPLRYWLVMFKKPATDELFYAVVLPDGTIIEPQDETSEN